MFFFLFFIVPGLGFLAIPTLFLAHYSLIISIGFIITFSILFILALPMINTWNLEKLFGRKLYSTLIYQNEVLSLYGEKISHRKLQSFRVCLTKRNLPSPLVFYNGWLSPGIIICNDLDDIKKVKVKSSIRQNIMIFIKSTEMNIEKRLHNFVGKNVHRRLLFIPSILVSVILTFIKTNPFLGYEFNTQTSRNDPGQ